MLTVVLFMMLSSLCTVDGAVVVVDTAPTIHNRPVAVAVVTPVPAVGPQTRQDFYLVTSPESSGNRFTVELLMSSGCVGVAGHHQPFDNAKRWGAQWPNHVDTEQTSQKNMLAPCFVFHRSVPHNGVWVNLTALVQEIEQAGFCPRLVIPQRPEHIVEASQMFRGHTTTIEKAREHVLRAEAHIEQALGQMPDVWKQRVLYESLESEKYIHWLFDNRMGRPLPADHPRFENRDQKHLREK